MKSSWQIRPALLSDADALSACMKAAYDIYHPRMDGAVLPPMVLDYEEEIEKYPTWVAVTDARVVGGLTMIFDPELATLANVAVCPDFQGQGVGKGLMSFAQGEAKDRGYDALCLATHVLLVETIALYLHLGWCEVDRDDKKVYMKKVF